MVIIPFAPVGTLDPPAEGSARPTTAVDGSQVNHAVGAPPLALTDGSDVGIAVIPGCLMGTRIIAHPVYDPRQDGTGGAPPGLSTPGSGAADHRLDPVGITSNLGRQSGWNEMGPVLRIERPARNDRSVPQAAATKPTRHCVIATWTLVGRL